MNRTVKQLTSHLSMTAAAYMEATIAGSGDAVQLEETLTEAIQETELAARVLEKAATAARRALPTGRSPLATRPAYVERGFEHGPNGST